MTMMMMMILEAGAAGGKGGKASLGTHSWFPSPHSHTYNLYHTLFVRLVGLSHP